MGFELFLKTWFFEKSQSNWIWLSNIESNFICKAIPLFMQISSAKSWNARWASHHPAVMGNCLTITHTCLPCLPSRWVSTSVLWPLMIGLNSGSVDIFLHMVRMVLGPWGAGAIAGNRCRIQGQNYVALLLGREMLTGFHYRNLILGIQCFMLITSNAQ